MSPHDNQKQDSELRIKEEAKSQSQRSVTSFASSAAMDPAAARAVILSREEWEEILVSQYYISEVAFTADDADLTIVVTGGHAVPPFTEWELDSRTAMVVRSKDIDRDLPGWRKSIAQLYPPREAGHLPIAELSYGTPLAIRYLIAAAHHSQEADIPGEDCPGGYVLVYGRRSTRIVGDVARLSHQWLEKSVPLKVFKPEEKSDKAHDLLGLLRISYEFRLEAPFKKVLQSKLTRSDSFHLAYVNVNIFRDPSKLPPGINDRIYRCREAYIISLLASIKTYFEDLRKVVKGQRLTNVCIYGSSAAKCAAEQLEFLEAWLEDDETIDINGRIGLWVSHHRSPIYFFTSSPRFDSLKTHVTARQGCGLARLVDEIKRDGKVRLMLWLLNKGDETSLVEEEHLQYLREQKKKIPWPA
ncbi:hypothetical protein N658DRAFT_535338 [Parathielavia hyrcaniae]|uniref:Uncharacterized protein n=1 Tax=Parathielavia hyrcaniae TaxID=113614 RepID=A0AAN6PZC8_9PEZI|nr:hypothetical protein N658DRAFT_535338 [Parathielavia hyrcaniae]